ncbi:hypothetical protein LTR62_000325 [Meristemomyces frigidus]|uniref:GH16 domain-containing protein n=1 Tax=Meristemomyces frigidus TaxID=1508187 RepID=A0AAN7TSP1_9PEZI|nr:hypothetical protein LTR62_000325 [Meristemomyces frigidus]
MSPQHLLLSLAILISSTLANPCPCGYVLNSTSASPASFTHHLQTDFTAPHPSLTWSDDPASDWQAQAYNVSAPEARGPYGKAAQTGNAVLASGNQGLDLYVRSALLDGEAVPIAEIVSTREDMLYGSFRIGMQTTAVNGTCGAFFFYHNDSQEIDLEILSTQQSRLHHPANLVLQTPQSVSAGYNAAGTPDFALCNLTFDPTAGTHEYRFDWLPERVDMFADGKWLNSFYEGVPGDAGALHVIHWSNGDPLWSGGPPAQDAVLRVSYVKAWFNSSMSGTGRNCKSSDYCLVDALPGLPSSAAPNAGSSGASGTKSSAPDTGGWSHLSVAIWFFAVGSTLAVA